MYPLARLDTMTTKLSEELGAVRGNHQVPLVSSRTGHVTPRIPPVGSLDGLELV
jgi:hypothetical protein